MEVDVKLIGFTLDELQDACRCIEDYICQQHQGNVEYMDGVQYGSVEVGRDRQTGQMTVKRKGCWSRDYHNKVA